MSSMMTYHMQQPEMSYTRTIITPTIQSPCQFTCKRNRNIYYHDLICKSLY